MHKEYTLTIKIYFHINVMCFVSTANRIHFRDLHRPYVSFQQIQYNYYNHYQGTKCVSHTTHNGIQFKRNGN